MRQRQIQAYLRAVDRGTIITSLPLLAEEAAETPDTRTSIERCKLTRSDKLHYLKNARLIKNTMWTFRRFGFTEEENPEHRLSVIEATPGSQANILHVVTTLGLVPTTEEYVDILHDLVKAQRGRMADTITVDAEAMADSLEAVVSDVPVKVLWYAPPSKEEEFLNDITNPHTLAGDPIQQLSKIDTGLCGLCMAPETDTGKPLLRCGGCKIAKYCCQSHQQIHWPDHRKLCKFAQRQVPTFG